MSLSDAIQVTILLVRSAYRLAVIIRDNEKLHKELQETVKSMATDFSIIGNNLDQLSHMANRVDVRNEKIIVENILLVQAIMTEATAMLKDVERDRTFWQRLFMKKDDYRKRLYEIRDQLRALCACMAGTLPIVNKILIPDRQFIDFRSTFLRVPEKTLSFYQVSIVKKTSHSLLSINFEEFDAKCFCYMKLSNKQVILSYQLRTWSALNPKDIVLVNRIKEFHEKWRHKSDLTHSGSDSSLESVPSPHSSLPIEPSPPVTAAANDNHKILDFSEVFMSHDDICGMTLTQSCIYIATKYEITIVSLDKQEIIAQYGTSGTGPNSFEDISYIYIPSNDETSLYIVDRGQCAVHHYKIDNTGYRLEYKRRYIVIANVTQQCNLISCVIYNENLYVSDDRNKCLHIFPLKGERQSCYLHTDLMESFSPGCLCAHEKYLYVANCSSKYSCILVFNEECKLVDCFRNQLLEEILTIGIDPHIGELYILTKEKATKKDKGKGPKKPAKTDKQKKAEAEMMRKVIAQYNGVLSSEDIKGMKEIFDTYDTSNQGFIKASTLGLILRTLGFNPRESDLSRVGKEFDPQKTDQLKFPEYVASILSIPISVADKEIIPAFQVFDPEKRGVLEADEILKSLTNVGEMLDEAEAKAFKAKGPSIKDIRIKIAFF